MSKERMLQYASRVRGPQPTSFYPGVSLNQDKGGIGGLLQFGAQVGTGAATGGAGGAAMGAAGALGGGGGGGLMGGQGGMGGLLGGVMGLFQRRNQPGPQPLPSVAAMAQEKARLDWEENFFKELDDHMASWSGLLGLL